MSDVMSAPWCLQIELCQGCNLSCSFCGLSSVYGNGGKYDLGNPTRSPFFFMTLETATEVAKQCADPQLARRRYEFAMHGEPTLNPNYLEIFSIFRQHLPYAQLQLTTNGVRMRNGKMQEEVDRVFDAGLDFIILDTYVEGGREELREQVQHLTDVRVIDFYNPKDDKEKAISPWYNYGRKIKRTIFLMDDLGLNDGQKKNRVIYNHAGNALGVPIPDEPLKKRCSLPFRELTVCYDGGVDICCQDFAHDLRISNIHDRSLIDIWFSDEFLAIRSFLYNKERTFTPCSRCNYSGGSRVGMLPEHSNPTDAQKDLVRRMVTKGGHKLNKFPKEVLF